MSLFNDNRMNGTVRDYWQSIGEQVQRAERKIASHPEAGLLLATVAGLFMGIWVKRS